MSVVVHSSHVAFFRFLYGVVGCVRILLPVVCNFHATCLYGWNRWGDNYTHKKARERETQESERETHTRRKRARDTHKKDTRQHRWRDMQDSISGKHSTRAWCGGGVMRARFNTIHQETTTHNYETTTTFTTTTRKEKEDSPSGADMGFFFSRDLAFRVRATPPNPSAASNTYIDASKYLHTRYAQRNLYGFMKQHNHNHPPSARHCRQFFTIGCWSSFQDTVTSVWDYPEKLASKNTHQLDSCAPKYPNDTLASKPNTSLIVVGGVH